MGATRFPINEYFTISFRLAGAPLERYSPFPEVEGFKKSGKSSTTTTRIVAGQSTVELLITQRYAALKTGEYSLPPFALTVNGQTVRSAGASLQVLPQGGAGPASTTPGPVPTEPSASAAPTVSLNLPEQRDEAFLTLETDHATVFQGEALHVGVYFYLKPADQGLLEFLPDAQYQQQLAEMLRTLRQPGVWTETFEQPEETLPDPVTVGGQPYLRFHLHEAVYYPLTLRPLQWPALSWQMRRYKTPRLVNDPGPRVAALKTYSSAPRTVQVLELPPHPLREQAVVGDYQALETLDRRAFRTGQAFTYTVRLAGQGNLTSVNLPAPPALAGLEVYGPEVQQSITRTAGRIAGQKTFRYRLVPRRPGPLHLDSLFTLVVFRPATRTYQVIQPRLQGMVSGPPARKQISTQTTDPYYAERLNQLDNRLRPITGPQQLRRYANAVLAVLLGLAVVGWWRARR